MTDNPITDPYAIARARLANGRHIADADVVALCDEIERLRKIETAAHVQWEAFGAYPGLVEVLK